MKIKENVIELKVKACYGLNYATSPSKFAC